MTYTESAKQAKGEAKDILRTEMAIRILDRIAEATVAFNSSVKHYATLVVNFAAAAKKRAENVEKQTENRKAYAEALAAVPGVSAEELAAVQATVAKTQASNDTEDGEVTAACTKEESLLLREAAEDIESSREEVTRLQKNLTKLEAGDLPVKKDELDALSQKLIRDGAIVAGHIEAEADNGADGAEEETAD